MSFSSGVFSLASGNPVVTGTTISSTWANNTLSDLATGLSTCLLKDGTQTVTANLPLSNFKITGLGLGTAAADAASVSQVQNSSFTSLTGVTGTNTVTATTTPSPAAYVIGQAFDGIAGGTNTGPVTLNISSLGAGAVQVAGAALTGGELVINSPFRVYVSALTPVFQLEANGQINFATLSVTQAASDNSTKIATTAYADYGKFGLTFAAAASALTITLTQQNGSAVSVGSPAIIPFRDVTAATADVVPITVTAATSVVLSSGSKLGAIDTIPFKGWVVAFNDAGTFRLGVINCAIVSAGNLSLYPLAQFGIASSTAEGGAGGADSAQVFYTGTAVASKAYTVLGYFSYEAGLTTAGTWASNPSRAQVFTPSTPLPGFSLQLIRTSVATGSNGGVLIPNDNTIPQNTEGTQFISAAAFTPSSASHVLRIKCFGNHCTAVVANATGALFQDSVANALAVGMSCNSVATGFFQITIDYLMLAASIASTTFKYRAGLSSANAIGFNSDSAGSQLFGGTCFSFIEIEEITT
jgi:hypothetical protein